MIDSLGGQELEDDFTGPSSSNRKDFSFNKIETRNSFSQSALRLEQIRHQLVQLDAQKLCMLLIQEIQNNEELRSNLLKAEGRLEAFREQIRVLSQSLAFKKESFLMLSETQSKNEQQIMRLEQDLKFFKGKYNLQSWSQKVDSEWHKKYNQLSRHMDIYVENNKEIQEEFARLRKASEKELQYAYDCNSELREKQRQLAIMNLAQAEELKSKKLEVIESRKMLEKLRQESQQCTIASEKICRLEQGILQGQDARIKLTQKCEHVNNQLRRSHMQNQQLRGVISKLEMSLSRQKEALEAGRATTDRQMTQLKAQQQKLQTQLETLRVEQTSHRPVEGQLREENDRLKEQLDQSLKTISSLKAEVVLLKGETDRARSHLKRQAQKNSEIRVELDRFCRRKREATSPDQVLSQIQNTANSITRKQYLSTHLKIQQFKLQQPTSKFSPGKQNRASCIIGEQASG